MKSAATISLVPEAKDGPFLFQSGLTDGCRRAAALGFDGVEIFPPSAKAIDQVELRSLLAAHKLDVAAIGTGAGWVIHKWSLTHPDAAIRARAVLFIRETIDVAAGFGAPAIIGSMQGRWDGAVSVDQARAWLSQGLEVLAAHAASHGQTVLFEPLNRYETNLFNRLSTAVAFLDKLAAPNVRILADLFHMNIEEPSIPDALRTTAGRVGHVHFADSNREAIGFGHTSLGPIMEALRDIGYSGYLSAEILPLPDSAAAALRAIESFRQYAA